jgi:uncharacterized protein YdeI (YjbR/CyaY-like superfamily)
MAITRDIDTYFSEGCGRCSLGGTPECKVHTWATELKLLRQLILECGLTEEVKWGSPCYTFQDSNVLMIGAFKEKSVLSFLKGALIKDEAGLLEWPGENSQSAKVFKVTKADQISAHRDLLKSYIFEAIELERNGAKVETKQPTVQDWPAELVQQFTEQPAFKQAFLALTPGRQRGYLMHFNSAKQSKTMVDRIQKCMPKIFEGKGMQE